MGSDRHSAPAHMSAVKTLQPRIFKTPKSYHSFRENPDVLGKLRLLWIKNGKRLHSNYNWKVSVFKSSAIEMIAMKAPLYAIITRNVDPGGETNSREHDNDTTNKILHTQLYKFIEFIIYA